MSVFPHFCDRITGMEPTSSHAPKIGYSRYEFGLIFQVYSRNVYSGLFKNFCFTEYKGHYLISFQEDARKTPLITVEKRRLGPDRNLFVATTPGLHGDPREIVRSEKIENFVAKLKDEVDRIREAGQTGRGSLRVVSG